MYECETIIRYFWNEEHLVAACCSCPWPLLFSRLSPLTRKCIHLLHQIHFIDILCFHRGELPFSIEVAGGQLWFLMDLQPLGRDARSCLELLSDLMQLYLYLVSWSHISSKDGWVKMVGSSRFQTEEGHEIFPWDYLLSKSCNLYLNLLPFSVQSSKYIFGKLLLY